MPPPPFFSSKIIFFFPKYSKNFLFFSPFFLINHHIFPPTYQKLIFLPPAPPPCNICLATVCLTLFSFFDWRSNYHMHKFFPTCLLDRTTGLAVEISTPKKNIKKHPKLFFLISNYISLFYTFYHKFLKKKNFQMWVIFSLAVYFYLLYNQLIHTIFLRNSSKVLTAHIFIKLLLIILFLLTKSSFSYSRFIIVLAWLVKKWFWVQEFRWIFI